jgi:hypothetical protein
MIMERLYHLMRDGKAVDTVKLTDRQARDIFDHPLEGYTIQEIKKGK